MNIHIADDDIERFESILLKANATELAALRDTQHQLAIYGDRREVMRTEVPAYEARIALLQSILAQIKAR